MPSPGEPLWLEEDIELAFEYLDFKRGICAQCGITHSKASSDEPIEVGTYRCHGCEAIEIRRRAFSRDAGDDSTATSGIKYYIK